MNYKKEHIEHLNEFGMLSTAFLSRKYGYNGIISRNILNRIVQDFENVYFLKADHICIEGRQIIKKNRKSKWKDVTKP